MRRMGATVLATASAAGLYFGALEAGKTEVIGHAMASEVKKTK